MIKKQSQDDYFADPAINASFLKKLRKSPLSAYAIEEEKESKALSLGSLYHTYILEPETFHDRYFIIDETPIVVELIDDGAKSPRSTKKYKEWKAEQAALAGDRELIENGLWLQVEQMALRLKQNNPNADVLIRNSDHEVSIYQDIESDGKKFGCKCRIDGFNAERGVIFDLKTTQNAHPDSFGRECGKFNYHIQTAFYKRMAELELGKPVEVFIIAQETVAPFNNALYHVSPAMIKKGDYEVEKLLKILSHVELSGELNSYEIFAKDPYGVLPLDIPNYYVNSYDLNI